MESSPTKFDAAAAAVKFLGALRVFFRVNFVSPGAVLRIAGWSLFFCLLLANWASHTERKLDSASVPLLDDAADAELVLAPGVFRVAVVGGSESGGRSRSADSSDNVVEHLAQHVRSRGYEDLLLYDFTATGIGAVDLRARVQRAVDYESDLVVLTSTVSAADYIFGRERTMLWQRPGGFAKAPSAMLDEWLARWFDAYENRFPNTLGRLAGVTREKKIAGRALAACAAGDDVPVIPLYWTRSQEVPGTVEHAIVYDPPESPSDRLRLLAAPALERGIPVLYVVTPHQRVDESDPVWYPLVKFDAELRTFDHQFGSVDNGLYYWPAYKEDWDGRLRFLDPVHMTSPEHFAGSLLDVIVDHDLLPEPAEQ